MSEDKNGARVYKALTECTKGALLHGFMYGAVGILFPPTSAPILMFIGFSAINGCLKAVIKIQCQSKTCELSVDVFFGSSGYVLRAGTPFVLGPIVERVVVGAVNGGLYGLIPNLLDGEDKQTLPPYKPSKKAVEVSLSDIVTPLVAEGFDGFLSDTLKRLIAGEPTHYAASIATGIKVGSVVFNSLRIANLTEKLFWQVFSTDEPAAIPEDRSVNSVSGPLVEQVSVSGDVAVAQENEEL